MFCWCPWTARGARPLLVLLLLQSVTPVGAMDRYVIPRLGTLKLTAPERWQVKFVYQHDLSDYPRWYLAPMDERLQLFLTLMWPDAGQARGPLRIRDRLERIGQRLLALSDQSRLRLIESTAGAHVVFYYDLSDREAQPPEYQYLRQGAVDLDGYVLVFTLLQHQADTGDGAEVMAMLANLVFTPLQGI